MFLRQTTRRKDGKEHQYWSLVENRRVDGGRKVIQRHVLYLGEINSSQQAAWRKTIEIFEEGSAQPRDCAFSGRRCGADGGCEHRAHPAGATGTAAAPA